MESLFSLSPLSSLFPSPPIRAIAGKRWTKQAGVSELRGGGWLRHAGRHQLGQKHSSHQGAPRLSTSVYATFLQNRKITAVQTSWWNLTTYSLFFVYRNIYVCLTWLAKTRGSSARNTKSTSGEDTNDKYHLQWHNNKDCFTSRCKLWILF